MATKKYLDENGLLYLWGKLKAAFASKSQAISSISRDGTTFTATRADGTTFTFTQQDNTVAAYTSTPAMNGLGSAGSQSKYSRGDHVHPTDTSRAPIASPAFTGTPTAPTPGENAGSTQIATVGWVEDIAQTLSDAIDALTGVTFSIVQELPASGQAGTIYLVPMSSGSGDYNGYFEYIYVSSKSGNVKWEKIGSTDVDMSGYIQSSDLVAITNAEIDTALAT